MKEDSLKYDDIINLQRHISDHRKPMSIRDRSAQFSPFAAVSGYDTAIKETARLTVQKVELDEHAKTVLDEKLRIVQEQINKQEEIEIIYFEPDEIKSGGSYVTLVGIAKKLDPHERQVLMKDGTRIFIEDILDIQGDMFQIIDDFFA